MDIDSVVERINELARKQKESGLTEEEIEERAKLRERYLQNVRRNFRQQLDSIEWVDEEKK
ncbi:DUF896 domain-containing protein [Paenibacillus cellulositrophicus]|uniref:UPF0291 protein BK138_17670 n=2 Tax=Paenibacillus TaxID=44249 RepID=A0A1R1EPD3_9BACL|nr:MULTISPECIES: DUF896 domain-containing protein [Paenibacillus]MBJ9988716.1 DUF896 domain-containing protein [Paenibacillus sp. S28]MCM2999108.1 DUF896 domain-containing protein [Paenibacillus cellulositrophicus]OMF53657.1 DUF896 family protein [Paenibacillus rhizosphaerae]OXL84461.1 hypothetical protein BCV73_16115 [Paenibacillus sp. SSG-1]RED39695.1 uncharacterized protein DUF896 [Paenibacillus sp. VMFN-D1]